jgi:hypothetical protein
MVEFKIIPHEAIGPARLGMTREEIRKIFGNPVHIEVTYVQSGIRFPDRDSFFSHGGFQVHYDSDLRVEFIEVAAEPDYMITFDGIPIHDSAPGKVVAAIQKYDEPDMTRRGYPTNLLFSALDLSLYREHSDKEPFDTVGISTKEYRRK